MPVDDPGAGVVHGSVRYRAAPAGLACLLGVAVLVLLIADRSRVAVGFVVPLLGAAAYDATLAARAIRARGVALVPVRTTAEGPDQLTFAVTSDPDAGPVRITLDPLKLGRPAPTTILPEDGPSTNLAWPAGDAIVTYFARYVLASTRLGLVTAHRATVVALPAGAWCTCAPAPRSTRRPPLVDEVGRLRAYVPGDRMSRVSWPTTARTGQLHVRTESIDPAEVVVRLELGSSSGEAEAALAHAGGLIGTYLEEGVPVRLLTRTYPSAYYQGVAAAALAHPDHDQRAGRAAGRGEVTLAVEVADDVVTVRDEMIRRLATAEFGEPIPPPGCAHVQVDAQGVRVWPG